VELEIWANYAEGGFILRVVVRRCYLYLFDGVQEQENLFLDRKWWRKGVIYFPGSIDKLVFSDYVYIPF